MSRSGYLRWLPRGTRWRIGIASNSFSLRLHVVRELGSSHLGSIVTDIVLLVFVSAPLKFLHRTALAGWRSVGLGRVGILCGIGFYMVFRLPYGERRLPES